MTFSSSVPGLGITNMCLCHQDSLILDQLLLLLMSLPISSHPINHFAGFSCCISVVSHTHHTNLQHKIQCIPLSCDLSEYLYGNWCHRYYSAMCTVLCLRTHKKSRTVSGDYKEVVVNASLMKEDETCLKNIHDVEWIEIACVLLIL